MDWVTGEVSLKLVPVRAVMVAVSPEELASIVEEAAARVCAEFADVFADKLEKLPPERPELQKALPRRVPRPALNRAAMFRRVQYSMAEHQFLVDYLTPLIEKGFIEPASTCEFNSPIHLVPKDPQHPDPMKHYRPVQDLRIPNRVFEV